MSRWRGRMVTLVEKRPGWAGTALEERPFAQLRYGVDGMWTLYYWDDDLTRWRKYPQSVRENSPVPLLADIDQNASDGYFFTLQS